MVGLCAIIGLVFFLLYQIADDKEQYNLKSARSGLSRGFIHYKYAAIKNFSHCQILEFTWTVLPACLLFAMIAPTFSIIYA